MRGRIKGDITWSEGDRTLSFDIETYIKDNVVGYAPKEDDFDDLWPDAIGVPWPLLFGNPIKVPCPQAIGKVKGTLDEALSRNYIQQWEANTAYSLGDLIFGYGLSPSAKYYECTIAGTSGGTPPVLDPDIGDTTTDGSVTWTTRDANTLTGNDNHSFAWEGIEDFPQGTPITIDIVPPPIEDDQVDDRLWGYIYSSNDRATIRYKGEIINDIFYVSTTYLPPFKDRNIPLYTGISFIDRPSVADDPDRDDATYAWIDTSSQIDFADQLTPLKGLICTRSWDGSGDLNTLFFNRCIEQDGNKLRFEKPWKQTPDQADIPSSYIYMSSGSDPILEAVAVGRTAWEYSYLSYMGLSVITFYNDTYRLPVGSTVYLASTAKDVYVANIITGGTVSQVFGEKVIDGENRLVELPTDEYDVDTDYTFAGAISGVPDVVAIEVARSLALRDDGDWTGKIFVTMTSSEGPNIADVIKWLIEEYTDLYLNSVSYDTTYFDVSSFPVDFAILDQPMILSLLSDISWQSRCALAMRNGEFILKYLSKVPEDYYGFVLNNMQLKTLRLKFSLSEDLRTKMNVKWKIDYSEDEDSQKSFIYENNVDKYGVNDEEKEIYIYKTESSIQMTAGFWGYRYSNSWRKVVFNSFLNALRLEVFDAVTIDIDSLSLNQLKGEVQKLDYNSDVFTINVDLELASRTGDIDSNGEPQVDLNYWLGDPRYPITVSSDTEGEEAKAVDVFIVLTPRAYLSGEGSYSGPWLWREESRYIWNTDHASFIAEYESRVVDPLVPVISKAIVFVPGGRFAPAPTLGYYPYGKYISSAGTVDDGIIKYIVGQGTEKGIANYEKVLAFALDEAAQASDYMVAYLKAGGDEGIITQNVTFLLDIANEPTKDWVLSPPAGYSTFKTNLAALGINVAQVTYNGAIPLTQRWMRALVNELP